MRPVVAALIVVQVALPGSMLVARWVDEGSRPTSERPASWQMYSFVPPAAYVGVDGSGAERALMTDQLPLLLRAVDVGPVVPDRLCAREPDLVEVRRLSGPDPGIFRC